MILAFLLLVIGLFLIFLEFFLPGAILGILGGLSIVAALVLVAIESSSLLINIGFFLATVVSLIALVRFTLWKIKHSKPSHSIYSNDSQEGFQAISYDKTLIGKRGTVLYDLKPGGYILIEGHQYPAISMTGYLKKGEEVIVLNGQDRTLMVKSFKKE